MALTGLYGGDQVLSVCAVAMITATLRINQQSIRRNRWQRATIIGQILHTGSIDLPSGISGIAQQYNIISRNTDIIFNGYLPFTAHIGIHSVYNNTGNNQYNQQQ